MAAIIFFNTMERIRHMTAGGQRPLTVPRWYACTVASPQRPEKPTRAFAWSCSTGYRTGWAARGARRRCPRPTAGEIGSPRRHPSRDELGERTRRKPMLLLLLFGLLLFRFATRTLFAELFQLPPRLTRLEPDPVIPPGRQFLPETQRACKAKVGKHGQHMVGESPLGPAA